MAIDFSRGCLPLNAKDRVGKTAHFVRADLTKIRFVAQSASGLMMVDFLQHIGDHEVQRDFLYRAIQALVPAGWFI